MSDDRETDKEWTTDEEFEVNIEKKAFVTEEIFFVQVDARHRLRAHSSGANNHVGIKHNGHPGHKKRSVNDRI